MSQSQRDLYFNFVTSMVNIYISLIALEFLQQSDMTFGIILGRLYYSCWMFDVYTLEI